MKPTLEVYLNRFPNQASVCLVGPMDTSAPIPLDPVVFVDGGLKHRSHSKIGFAVGDGDSSRGNLDELLPTSKDYSDLSYVFSKLPPHIQMVTLEGFLGGRRDQELMNFAEAHQFLKRRSFPTQVNFQNEVRGYSKGAWKQTIQGVFSVFCFEEANVVLSGELDYQTSDQKPLKPISSHGLSNQAHGEVHIECKSPIFVLIPPQPRL